jgi:excisionase family DNA binding protein
VGTVPVSTPATLPTDLISPSEAAALVSSSHWTIRRRIADGSLTGYRFGPRTLRVSRAEVLGLVRVVPTAGAR